MSTENMTMTDLRREIQTINSLMDTLDWKETMLKHMEEFDYQGLNLEKICQTIFARGKSAGKNKSAIHYDITYMITLFLTRGNNIDKMLAKTSDAGVAKISACKTTYGLVSNVGKGGSNVITLSRVASTFSLITCRTLTRDDLPVPRAVNLSTSHFGEEFPKCMQTVIVASLIPKTEIGRQLMKALLLYLIEETKLLSSERLGDDKDILAKVCPYARASFMSNLYDHPTRVTACVSLGLINEVAEPGSKPEKKTLVINPNVSPAVNTFSSKYPTEKLSFFN
nr:MAG: nucleoprotein [Anopheles phasivirus 2]